jgi:hypothetical protein
MLNVAVNAAWSVAGEYLEAAGIHVSSSPFAPLNRFWVLVVVDKVA